MPQDKERRVVITGIGAMSNTFGFSGGNAVLVITEAQLPKWN